MMYRCRGGFPAIFKGKDVDKTEWIEQCAARLVERGISPGMAQGWAVQCWEDRCGDTTPQQAADDEIAAWNSGG